MTFRRDKDGNLYAVKNGKIVGQVVSMGDQLEKKEKKDGNNKRR